MVFSGLLAHLKFLRKDVSVLPACNVHTLCACNALGGQKRASDTLEMELRKVISCDTDTGNQP